jgi:hypothetical protein
MADGSERRIARRFTMSLPLRVLPSEPSSSEFRTQTRDVSYQGLYSPKRNSKLAVRLSLS